MFLTRGNLWINWELGMEYFMENLVDSDWAICSGNWMWISGAAVEWMLNTSIAVDPVLFGKRLEASGDYIRRHVPELVHYSYEFIHEPWKAPVEVQRAANCIIGKLKRRFLFYDQSIYIV